MDEPSATGVDAGQDVPAHPSSRGPAAYALAAVRIAQLDTEAIVRVSRDPSALAYGGIVLGGVNVLLILITTVLVGHAAPNPWALGLAALFNVLASAASTGLMHVAAKVLFGATGSYVGLLRVLWLGSIVSLLILVPIVGPIAGGLWSLLITMVTFQEVDGIERLQALALAIGLSAGVYMLGMLLARGH